jgi:hypothetical protein
MGQGMYRKYFYDNIMANKLDGFAAPDEYRQTCYFWTVVRNKHNPNLKFVMAG